MLDDFFTRALICGVMLAAIAGPLGSFVVWRRLAYLGDAMAHAALLGVSAALLLDLNQTIGVFLVVAGIAVLLARLETNGWLTGDALLGILSHSALAVGLLLISVITWIRIDLLALLFGDILAVSRADVWVILTTSVVGLAVLLSFWRSLLASTVSPEIAVAEGLRPMRDRLVLMLLLAGLIAIAMKIVGVLLVTSLLIIPATTARPLATTPESMAIGAGAIGVVATLCGLLGSLRFDTPPGPSVVAVLAAFFLASSAWAWFKTSPWRRDAIP